MMKTLKTSQLLIPAMLVIGALTACSKPGEEFVGTWVNVANHQPVVITRHGDTFEAGDTYYHLESKGTLIDSAGLATLTIDPKSGDLVFQGLGKISNVHVEFRRE